MAVQVSYPGVYIDEFTPAAPIQGVGTSTVAFLGLCKYGPPNEATLITSWDAFLRTFTSGKPVNEDPPNDDEYLWYAVQGFFQNGGQVCYVTAVSNASPDYADLLDQASPTPAKTIRVTARRSGISNPQIKVSAAASNSVKGYDAAATPNGARLFAPSVAGVTVAVANRAKATFASDSDAAQFLAGDRLKIDGGGNTELPTVEYRVGKDVFLAAELANTYANATVTLAPLDAFATTFRVSGDAAAALVSGSIVTLSQQGNATPPKTTIVTNVTRQRISPTLTTYRVSVKDGVNGFNLYGGNAIALKSEEFTLTVSGLAQAYDGLSMNAGHPRYFATIINSDPNGTISAVPAEGPNTTALPNNRPNTLNAANVDVPVPLTSGADFDPTLVNANDYGEVLDKLQGKKDINIVVVADRTDSDVQGRVLAHCELLHDRFAIFDARRGTQPQDIDTQRGALESDKGFGALYYPWISVSSAKTGQPVLMPPSGYVAGIYARTDASRGVFKAPAGTEATVSAALGVELPLSDVDHGRLNLKGINVIRVFQQGGRPVVWGARTTTTNTNWQYVNIRRLFIFLEESIKQGIRGSVFEPNNLELWQKLKRTISAFLAQQWRDGALFGATEKDAFYVRIDEAINPPDQRALGRLYVEIGVKPSYPAEFIVVRIGIWEGGSEVTE